MTAVIMEIIFIGKVKFCVLRPCCFTNPGSCLTMSGSIYSGGVYDLCLSAGHVANYKYECLIIIEKGEIFIYRGSSTSCMVKCVSPFSEFIELLRKLAPEKSPHLPYTGEIHDFIDALTPNTFKDSFGPIFPAELKPMFNLPRILWAFIQAPELDIEVGYKVYSFLFGTTPEYPLDIEKVERYLLAGKYSIKLIKDGRVIKNPDRTSGIMVIVDTGSDYEFAGII